MFLHDDVIKWKHFPRYWPFVRGIHRSPVNSPHKGQWRGTFDISIDLWLNKLLKTLVRLGFETLSSSLWRHCNVKSIQHVKGKTKNDQGEMVGREPHRDDMITLSALLALCEGNPPLTGGFPTHRVSVRRALIFFVVVPSLNKLLNKRWVTGDSRHHDAHENLLWCRGHHTNDNNRGNGLESQLLDLGQVITTTMHVCVQRAISTFHSMCSNTPGQYHVQTSMPVLWTAS